MKKTSRRSLLELWSKFGTHGLSIHTFEFEKVFDEEMSWITSIINMKTWNQVRVQARVPALPEDGPGAGGQPGYGHQVSQTQRRAAFKVYTLSDKVF